MEYKYAPFEMKGDLGDSGTFEGYASTFGNTDQGGDVVERGAFTKSLGSGRKVRMLWQHDTSTPIGVWESVSEDTRGLYVKGRILAGVQKGSDALELMRAGAIDSLSIGYQTVEAVKDGNKRRLTELKLHEISVVTFPMNEAATISDVKSLTTEREFERFLRDAGLSRKEAAAVTLHGFKGLTGLRDAVPDEARAEGLSDLLSQISKLQEHFNA